MMSTKFKFSVLLLIALIFIKSINSFAQTREQIKQIIYSYDLNKLQEMEMHFKEIEALNKLAVLKFANRNNIPLRITLPDGGISELQRIDAEGTPIYYRTFNVAAAKSTRTNHLNIGGSLGLDLMGLNMTAHVWDGGLARKTHQEYHGVGGANRYSVGDGSSSLHYHSAHVAGTIMASGVRPAAKGMAPYCKVIGYDWSNDISEAAAAAANGMLISNHSYGLNPSGLPASYFGAYISESRDWDNIMRNAPYFLMVVAAGNSGQSNVNTTPLVPTRPKYDKLTDMSTCKNNLAVAMANDANIDANGNLISVTINPYSSQGPTDDLRIKPDITGNGTDVYSTYESSNTAYESITGTSMASPNVAGSILLLQEYYKKLNDFFMKAATLKGLVLHTADDAGMVGPDAIYGWGLLNSKRAAESITQRGAYSIIEELTINQGDTITLQVHSDELSPLLASISWTDLPGTASTALNNTTPRLVNDLDIRVSKSGVISYPWRLTCVDINDKGDNFRDPFERVDVNNASGTYTITITHKGNLAGGSQDFSLIVTGIKVDVTCYATTPTYLNVDTIGHTTAKLSWDAVNYAAYQVQYQEDGTSTWTTINSASNTVTLTGLISETTYNARVRSICPDDSVSQYTNIVSFTTTEADTIAPTTPTNLAASNISQTSLTLNWTPSTDNVGVSGYDVFMDYVFLQTVPSNTANITGLTASTTYQIYIRARDAQDNISAKSDDISVTTLSIPLTYCVSKGNSTNNEYIGRVQFNTIDNISDVGTTNVGYSNFTNISTTIHKGASYTITITPTWLNSISKEGYAAWIDFNKNGSFESNELVWSCAPTQQTPVSGNITIPNTALEGQTVMRVSLKNSGTPSACETFSRGEVEDYSIIIAPAIIDTIPPTAPSNLVASNITQTSLMLNWSNSIDNVSVTGYDIYMDNILLQTVASTYTNITGLTANTSYQFFVKAKDGIGNISVSSNTISVATLQMPDIEPPTAPTDLHAVNITETSITLNWNASSDNVGVTGYDVYLNTGYEETVSSNTATYTGFLPGSFYLFHVRARDAAGNTSEESNICWGFTLEDTQAPTAPSNLEASNITNKSLTLNWTASTDNFGVAGYEVLRNNNVIATVPTNSANVSGLSGNTTYQFAVRAIDDADNISPNSDAISVTTLPNPLSYCVSKSSSDGVEWIGKVQFNTINNVSGNGTTNVGYSNFTNISTTIHKGSSYTITVTPKWTGTAYSEGYAVWIDYNKNGIFEANENVWYRHATLTSPVSGNITIPNTALDGPTRMRVSMKANSTPSACETFFRGEVEDYTVIIEPAIPDSIAPTAPSNLIAANITHNSLTLLWTASTDNVGVTGYDVLRNNNVIATVTSNSANISELSANTSYQFAIRAKDVAGNISANSETLTVPIYCESKASTTVFEYIEKVEFNTISCYSGSGVTSEGYSNFTNINTTIHKGSTYTISITPYWIFYTRNEGYAVWIDYNKNGIFESNEMVWSQSPTTNTPVSGTITIPNTALEGTTRMRVSMKYNNTPFACENFSFGEVEDYSVIIAPPQYLLASNEEEIQTTIDNLFVNPNSTENLLHLSIGDETQTLIDNLFVYPNPTENLLYLSSIEQITQITIFNQIGQQVISTKASEVIDVSNLKDGIYVLKIYLNNGTMQWIRFSKI